ncbi:CGNR zinc finger domain-containing protein [Streptomyces alkaliterrae]|uniref:CGNR zinc finger domain-containing protein n=1 Tax=Streptomyces alkaliterrae TaxID=2213162 RepID=A0A5P0YN69_9ACTN|nr:CGNR zinc finger domain-containing protein [Streptomyces alkaliterrae]MBB1258615.1 CGNR zinc finger domain-containing protein [Streptomyces alkaliterrae]MQS01794.1 zf-CGNR multi-domain protein [Streptomyces alkaliterrae]
MELTYYADFAVRLVNTEEPERGTDTLTSVEVVRELFGGHRQAARRVSDADVNRLRAVRARLRAVFAAAGEQDEFRAVDLLNTLLMEYPASPQIAGHDYRDEDGNPRWHLHLAENPVNAGAGYAAIACMGLAVSLTELGVDRLGVCNSDPCRNAYIDTSTNRSRRYCSGRCATRANVAAYRARKRAESGRHTSAGRPAEDK